MKRVEILVPMWVQIPEGLTPKEECSLVNDMLLEMQGSGNQENAKLIDIDYFNFELTPYKDDSDKIIDDVFATIARITKPQ